MDMSEIAVSDYLNSGLQSIKGSASKLFQSQN